MTKDCMEPPLIQYLLRNNHAILFTVGDRLTALRMLSNFNLVNTVFDAKASCLGLLLMTLLTLVQNHLQLPHQQFNVVEVSVLSSKQAGSSTGEPATEMNTDNSLLMDATLDWPRFGSVRVRGSRART